MVYIITGTACSKTLHGLKGWQQLSVIKQADFPPPASTPPSICGCSCCKALVVVVVVVVGETERQKPSSQLQTILLARDGRSVRRHSGLGWGKEQVGGAAGGRGGICELARLRPHRALGLVYSHQEAGWVPVFQPLCPMAEKEGGGHIPVCSTDPSQCKRFWYPSPPPPAVKTGGPFHSSEVGMIFAKCTRARMVLLAEQPPWVMSLQECLFSAVGKEVSRDSCRGQKEDSPKGTGHFTWGATDSPTLP